MSFAHDPHVIRFTSDENGNYSFRACIPTSYSVPTDGTGGDLLALGNRRAMRPAHIHFQITAPNYNKLVTHLFVAGDPYIEEDAVLAVVKDLVVEFPLNDDLEQAQALGLWKAPFSHSKFDIFLTPKDN